MTAAVKKTAAKIDTKLKLKLKSKSELNSVSTNSDRNDDNNDNNEIKKKKSIYKTIQMWHWHLEHLNVSDIIQLFKNSQSEIKIKKFKFLSFCEACKLAEFKKNLMLVNAEIQMIWQVSTFWYDRW